MTTTDPDPINTWLSYAVETIAVLEVQLKAASNESWARYHAMYKGERQYRALQKALEIQHPDRASVVYELSMARSKIEKLKLQLTIFRESAEKKNRALDALHYVWCSGPCKTGWHRYVPYVPIHPDAVLEALHMVRRIAGRWLTSERRAGRDDPRVGQMLVGPAHGIAGVVEAEGRAAEAEHRLALVRRSLHAIVSWGLRGLDVGPFPRTPILLAEMALRHADGRTWYRRRGYYWKRKLAMTPRGLRWRDAIGRELEYRIKHAQTPS